MSLSLTAMLGLPRHYVKGRRRSCMVFFRMVSFNTQTRNLRMLVLQMCILNHGAAPPCTSVLPWARPRAHRGDSAQEAEQRGGQTAERVFHFARNSLSVLPLGPTMSQIFLMWLLVGKLGSFVHHGSLHLVGRNKSGGLKWSLAKIGGGRNNHANSTSGWQARAWGARDSAS